MSDTPKDVNATLQDLLVMMPPYLQLSREHISYIMEAACAIRDALAAIPMEPQCKANAIEAISNAFGWTMRGIVEHTPNAAEFSSVS